MQKIRNLTEKIERMIRKDQKLDRKKTKRKYEYKVSSDKENS